MKLQSGVRAYKLVGLQHLLQLLCCCVVYSIYFTPVIRGNIALGTLS